MFASAVDSKRGLAVWIFSGPVNTDADHEAHVRSIEELAAAAADLPSPAAILIVDTGNPAPNAQWRKRIAEASAALPPSALVVLATRSDAARGAVTAIHWIRPPRYQLAVEDTFAHALAFIEEQRGKRIPVLQELHARARAILKGLSTDLPPPRRSIALPPISSAPPSRRSIAPPPATPSSPSRSIPPSSRSPHPPGSDRSAPPSSDRARLPGSRRSVPPSSDR